MSLHSTPVCSLFLSDVKPYCNKTGVQITEITWDVVTSRRYSYEVKVEGLASEVVKCKRSSLYI